MTDTNNDYNRLQELKEDLADDLAASEDVRDQANEEYRFTQVPNGHWEGWLEDDYEDRAKMQMDHSSSYLRRLYATWTNNRQAVNYSPSDDATNKDDAELLDGLYRRDTNRKGGQSAYDTAVFEGLSCGYGALVINTEYEDAGDPENEHQNIIFSEQPNAYSTVIFDSSARRADKGDANRCNILTPYSKKNFEKNWPDANVSTLGVNDRSSFNWYGDDLWYVGTNYEIDEERIILETFTHPDSGEIVRINRKDVDQEEMDMFGFQFARSRTVTKQSTFKTIYSGSDILVPRKRIAGRYIPVIPFFGFRGYVDGKEYYHGVIREKMDAQRGLNMTYSLLMETAAHASDDTPVFAPEQMENPAISEGWAENRHQKPFLLADPIRNNNGDIVQSGVSMMMTGGAPSQALISAIEMNSQSLQQSTGGAPQDVLDPNSSGKAINAIFAREDQNVAMVFDNFDKSIKHSGVVYESIATEIYGGKSNAGRRVRTVNDRGDAKPVTLMESKAQGGRITLTNDVSSGKFDVVVSVSKNFQTEQQETFEAMKDIAMALPPQDPLRGHLLRLMVLQKESSGMKDIQLFIRRELLAAKVITPESEEDQQYMVEMEEKNANKPQDPNEIYMLAEAEKAKSASENLDARTIKTGAEAAKVVVEAEGVKLDNMLLADEIQNPQRAAQ